MLHSPFSPLAVLLIAIAGCDAVSKAVTPSWHDRFGWEAEQYFDDPQVIALCEAIEANDLEEMDRLIEAGADVNANGKGNMTPLLWAYPDNKLPRFRKLLEHGADPNVIFKSDFNTRGSGIRPGDSITHMVCKTSFPGYFEAVFENGGAVNLVNSGRGNITETPIFKVIKAGGPGQWDKIQHLIEHGADLDYVSGLGITPPMQTLVRGGQYRLALRLLEAGADYRIFQPRSNTRLIHVMALEKSRRERLWTPQQEVDFSQLLNWLEKRGESLAEAEEDIERWRSWMYNIDNYRRKLDEEIAERKAREAREKGKNAAGEES